MARGGAARAAAVASNRALQSHGDDSMEDLEYIPSNIIPPIHPAAAADPPIPRTTSYIKYRTESEGVPLYTVIVKPLNPIAAGNDLDGASGQQQTNSISPIQENRLISNITLEEILDYVSYGELERFEHLEFRQAKAAEDIARAAQEEEERHAIMATLARPTITKSVGRPTRGRGRGRGRPRGSAGRSQPLSSRPSASASVDQSGEQSTDAGSAEEIQLEFESSRDQSPNPPIGEKRSTGPSIADISVRPRLVPVSLSNGKRKARRTDFSPRASPSASASAQLHREESLRAETKQTQRPKRPSPEVIIASSPQSKKRATTPKVANEAQHDIDIIDLDSDIDESRNDNIVDLGSGSDSSQPELFADSPPPEPSPPPPNRPQNYPQNHSRPTTARFSIEQTSSATQKRKSPEKPIKTPQHVVLEDDDDSDIQVLYEGRSSDGTHTQSQLDLDPDERVIERILQHLEHDGIRHYRVKYVGIAEHESIEYIPGERLRQDERLKLLLQEYIDRKGLSDDDADDGDDDEEEEDEEEESEGGEGLDGDDDGDDDD